MGAMAWRTAAGGTGGQDRLEQWFGGQRQYEQEVRMDYQLDCMHGAVRQKLGKLWFEAVDEVVADMGRE